MPDPRPPGTHLRSGHGPARGDPLSDLLFTIVALIAGALSIFGAVLALYLAWLTRRAVSMGADAIRLPLARRPMEPPSVGVLIAFAAAFAVIGAGLVTLALVN